MTKQSAQDAFAAKTQEIRDVLTDIMVAADDHFDRLPDNVNWGDVGDLSLILKYLKEAREVAIQNADA